jgi:hypothetical protein
MDHQLQQYRFARIEARSITRARLEAQFRDGITDLEELEKAIERQLTMEPTCTPWRRSEVEQAGSRDGTRMAALEFYWEHRRRRPSGSGSLGNRGPLPARGPGSRLGR